jgi:hypothetical protein
MQRPEPSSVRLSALTTDPELQRIFRQIEDDGAVDAGADIAPRAPDAGGYAMATREMIPA